MSIQLPVSAQSQGSGAPRVVIPTGSRSYSPSRPVAPSSRILYPWKTYVTATIFWCGEQPTERNPTPNCKSSWDTAWAENFGGYDDPDPKNRIANHTTGEFRPKNFIPKLNPFYIALPYNDVQGWSKHKPEASKVIPWFNRMRPAPGKTVLKGRWVQIFYNNRSCYAQWEDCGPWVTDDWQYVFGKNKPKATQNGAAGIDLSPSIRDYLGVKSGTKVHWRFVEDGQVPYGPWKKYGTTAPAQVASYGPNPAPVKDGESLEAQRKYLEYLRKLRDEQYMKKPLSEL
ncbi:hypothetical protein ACFSSA_07760 [Luteolibacter algae]|uniref:Uncharacterized protein n=1 Tax=Luteolibacter algae TaxID=454151 RepID=A0ABW5D683_9BACT